MKNHKTTRRKFLNTSIKAGASVPFLSLSNEACATSPLEESSDKKLNILILGGTSYLGPHQIAYALKQGHKITTFTRGKTKPTIHPELFDQVEMLLGDRNDNLEALKGRKWDAVIDNSGRQVKWTTDTAELLKDNIGMYVYISSVSAFYPYTGNDFSENRKLVLEIPKDLEEGESRLYEYGVMKANSENEAKRILGKDRAAIIRPHFIVGPGDKQDRFHHWAIRMNRGGEIVIPGKATDKVQYIDVRDVAAFSIRLIENKTAGMFNAAGPASPMTSTAFVHGAHAAFSSPVEYFSIDDHEFLKENNMQFLCPWVLPDAKFVGMCSADNSSAIKAGLTFRPLANTLQDIYEWWQTDAVTEERRNNMLTGKDSVLTFEKKIIEAWKNR